VLFFGEDNIVLRIIRSFIRMFMVVNVNIINVNIINVKRYRNRTIAGESQNVHLAVKDKLKKRGAFI